MKKGELLGLRYLIGRRAGKNEEYNNLRNSWIKFSLAFCLDFDNLKNE